MGYVEEILLNVLDVQLMGCWEAIYFNNASKNSSSKQTRTQHKESCKIQALVLYFQPLFSPVASPADRK